MRILFLSHWYPYPANNGSRIRIFNLLKQLSAEHEVSLLSFADAEDGALAQAPSELARYCADIHALPYREFEPRSGRALLGAFSRLPRSIVATRNEDMMRLVAERARQGHYDVLVVSELGMIPYAQAAGGIPAILEDPELSVFVDQVAGAATPAQRLRRRLMWLKLVDYLRKTLPGFAACTVVSPREKGNVAAAVPDYEPVHIVPNGIDLSSYDGLTPLPRLGSLVYAGALSYNANYDAVQHFLRDIYPTITEAASNVSFRVTGSTKGVDLASLPEAPGVSFTGYVDDIRPVVAESWASVVPLRVGGGSRIKILESMALGTPVVSTSKGAEGLDVTDGQNILIADHPSDFVDRVVELLRSPELRARIAQGGRELVHQYDWNVLGQDFRAIIARVGTRADSTREFSEGIELSRPRVAVGALNRE
jgi:polysaccharide biosynthesis protein PslH